ncbi:MAG: glycosyltransferase [Ignavibacteria bacterium]|nr:glycosyltransferase [Ignavibacteria bacterium]
MNTDGHRKVLVIAYYFPPMGLSGVQRTLKFVKYLPRYNWHPTVLTVDPVGYFAYDETLLSEITSPGITVVRTEPAGPGGLFRKDVVSLPSERVRKLLSRVSDTVFIPDNKIGWRNKALERAVQLHAKEEFDILFATAPPFTDFLVGIDVAKIVGKPLVIDYRDPWVDYPFKFYPTPVHKWRTIALERKVLRNTRHVITTNRRVKETLIARHGFLTHHDISIISQGFDPEDFSTKPPRRTDKKMRITYAGIFWEDRVPDYFLQALHDLLQRRPELRNRIEARFIGNFREENKRIVERLQLGDVVSVVDYLPHKKSVLELLASDVLWMIIGDDLGTPGKLYEYIGAGKAILGCAPEGFLAQSIIEAGGRVVAPKDAAGITRALEALYEAFRKGKLPGPAPEIVGKYDRIQLTGSLVRIFEAQLVR